MEKLLEILPVSDNPLEGYSPYFAIVSSKLRAIRRHRGYSQDCVASELNISRLTYGKYENDPRLMPLGTLLTYVQFFNIKINDILE